MGECREPAGGRSSRRDEGTSSGRDAGPRPILPRAAETLRPLYFLEWPWPGCSASVDRLVQRGHEGRGVCRRRLRLLDRFCGLTGLGRASWAGRLRLLPGGRGLRSRDLGLCSRRGGRLRRMRLLDRLRRMHGMWVRRVVGSVGLRLRRRRRRHVCGRRSRARGAWRPGSRWARPVDARLRDVLLRHDAAAPTIAIGAAPGRTARTWFGDVEPRSWACADFAATACTCTSLAAS